MASEPRATPSTRSSRAPCDRRRRHKYEPGRANSGGHLGRRSAPKRVTSVATFWQRRYRPMLPIRPETLTIWTVTSQWVSLRFVATLCRRLAPTRYMSGTWTLVARRWGRGCRLLRTAGGAVAPTAMPPLQNRSLARPSASASCAQRCLRLSRTEPQVRSTRAWSESGLLLPPAVLRRVES
jgi:hypothetical protein